MPYVTLRKNEPDQTFDCYYELHGSNSAPHKLVLIMGLNSTSQSWKPFQTDYFGQGDWQCVIFDNRGVGKSGYPKGTYKTSEMAKDTWELMLHLGWIKNVYVMGVSMGGMITQELLLLVPQVIAGAVLLSTTPGRRLPPLTMFTGSSPLTAPKELEARIKWGVSVLFPEAWLNQPYRGKYGRFDGTKFATNRDFAMYFAEWRARNTTPQRPEGASAQAGACIRHHVSAERLEQIKASGIPMLVITGTIDNLIRPADSTYLAKYLDCPLLIFEGSGHALPTEQHEKLNHAVMEHFRSAIQLYHLESPRDLIQEKQHPIEKVGQKIESLAKLPHATQNSQLDNAVHHPEQVQPSGLKPSPSFSLEEYWA